MGKAQLLVDEDFTDKNQQNSKGESLYKGTNRKSCYEFGTKKEGKISKTNNIEKKSRINNVIDAWN